MTDMERLKALADQIAFFAVTLKGSSFTIAICNGDVQEEDAKRFRELLMEAISSNQWRLDQAKSGNPE